MKYGADNPELQGEVAATRLLSALGFPADDVHVVGAVRCFGCPADPFPILQRCWKDGDVVRACLGPIDCAEPRDFTPARIERRFPGEAIEARRNEGWAWNELDQIDPAQGGASRADVDALRLMAVFLPHWDNKARNQRLLCLETRADPRAPCQRPLAMIADAGATFGPDKVNLDGWVRAFLDRRRLIIDGPSC